MNKQGKRFWLRRYPIAAGLIVLLVLVAVVTVLELTNTTYLFHKRPVEITASPATKGEHFTQDELDKSNASKGNKHDNAATTDPKADDSVKLEVPTGVFISNHHPNLSGNPAPNQIQSVCTTTSGATCTIVFTKGDITKSLPSQMTDSGGSTYWTWKLQDIGLTEGTWQVQARATLGNQEQTANDLMDLVVAK